MKKKDDEASRVDHSQYDRPSATAASNELVPTKDHVHDCTGPDARCPCGYVFRVPPICVSIEVFDRRKELVSEGFNCDTVDGAIIALRRAADRLEREYR